MIINVNEIKTSCWVGEVTFAKGAFKKLPEFLDAKRVDGSGIAVFFVDHYFKNNKILDLPLNKEDEIYYVNSDIEPKSDQIDDLVNDLRSKNKGKPSVIVGIGGGCTLDTSKAVANMLTNEGKAEDYQGWDLVKNRAIYKIGVPTISGTGAEASRTCVLLNKKKNLKLGMNSKYTLFDQLILDPNLTATVERNQYFYTGMDTYIHCIESLAGSYRNFFADTYSRVAIDLSRDVFLSDDMMSDENREKLMLASFLGGCAIANSYVGLVHPFSAGLSVVFDTHHCIGNCISLDAMEDIYPEEHKEFRKMMELQKVELPKGLCAKSDEAELKRLMASTLIHEVPLFNALGEDFKTILNEEKVFSIFKKM